MSDIFSQSIEELTRMKDADVDNTDVLLVVIIIIITKTDK